MKIITACCSVVTVHYILILLLSSVRLHIFVLIQLRVWFYFLQVISFFFWGRTPCVLSVPTHTHMHIHTCVHTERTLARPYYTYCWEKGWQNGDFWQQLLHARLISVQKNFQLIWDPNVLMKAASNSLHIIIFVKSLQFSTRYSILLSPKVSAKFLYNTTQISTAQVRRGVIGYRLSIIRVKATTLSLCVQITLSSRVEELSQFSFENAKKSYTTHSLLNLVAL